jgi:PBSX family phage terminase large subunit
VDVAALLGEAGSGDGAGPEGEAVRDALRGRDAPEDPDLGWEVRPGRGGGGPRTFGQVKAELDRKVEREMRRMEWRFTPEISEAVVQDLVRAFHYGCTDAEACAYARVKHSTFAAWLQRNPDFAERRLQLKDLPVIMARQAVARRVAGDARKGVEPDAYLAFRVLERLRRKEFGPAASDGEGPEGAAAGYADVPARLVGPQFADLFRDVSAARYTHYWEYGGRGAGRSSAVSLCVAHVLMTRPGVHALICRQVGNTLRDSVFSQMQWAVEELGLADLFTVSRSRLEIESRRTGQKMYFRGLDEPTKIKSIKPRKGYIGVFWMEEADQVAGPEVLRSVQQSIMRGGEDFWFFRSWNTPRDKGHWINGELVKAAGRADVRVHRADYRQTPREWLGGPFVEEAEALRVRDPDSYRHEYLGEAIGYGGEIFRNLSLERISDETVARFDNVKYGIDWGFTRDPFVFVKVHYDVRCRALFVFEELVSQQLTDDVIAEQLAARGAARTVVPIIADSADPKSIENLRSRGFHVLGATKFNLSVEHGVKFMQGMSLIVIDPARCPVAAREFTGYSNVRGPGGEYLPVIRKVDDHTVDAVRYALNVEICSWGPARSGHVRVL